MLYVQFSQKVTMTEFDEGIQNDWNHKVVLVLYVIPQACLYKWLPGVMCILGK
jgi:hypothetical protein